jgi:hypothetical protein
MRHPLTPRLTHPALVLLACLLALLTAACDSSASTSGGPTPRPATATNAPATATTAPGSATATPAGILVKVFFSKHPETDNNPVAVFPVNRVSPDTGVIKFAITQLIAGPTASEKASGYYTPLTAALTGLSNCGGPDFQVARDVRGTTPEVGTVTLRFCRTVSLAGDLTGGVIAAEITQIILQFPNNTKVVILTKDGGCFNDLSGRNNCLS